MPHFRGVTLTKTDLFIFRNADVIGIDEIRQIFHHNIKTILPQTLLAEKCMS